MDRSGPGRELKNYIQLFIFTFYITIGNFIVIGLAVFVLWEKIQNRDVGRTGPGRELEDYIELFIIPFYITVQIFIVISPTVFALWGKFM